MLAGGVLIGALVLSAAAVVDRPQTSYLVAEATAPVLPLCWPLEEVHYMVSWRAANGSLPPEKVCLNFSVNGTPVESYRNCQVTLDDEFYGDFAWNGGPDSAEFNVRAELTGQGSKSDDIYHVSVLNFPAPHRRLSCRRPWQGPRPLAEVKTPETRARPVFAMPVRPSPGIERVSSVANEAPSE